MTRLLPGRPHPLGATYDGSGTNFAVHSDVADAVSICLFDEAGTETAHRLDAHTGSIFHGYLTDVGPGSRYGIRVEGPWDPRRGLWCNSAKLLIDPYARAIDGAVSWDRAMYGFTFQDLDQREPHDSGPFAPRCLVVDDHFDWQGDEPPLVPWHEMVIYETHVKNLTWRHPGVPDSLRGTFLGVASDPIVEHLVSLGVTTVELMPVFEFVHDHTLVSHGRRNLWGYQPIGWFAPHHEYAAGGTPGSQVPEFKEMVRRLHAAGLEVILDAVYNHTGESHHLGPQLSLRGIDNPAYYRLSDDDRRHYVDFTGTGNTINTDHPVVLRTIADSLRHWVNEFHVDGFRLDLAATLARSGLQFEPMAPFFQIVNQDPVLNQVKMVAEPWDVGPGGYRLGSFPATWGEWNDRYRDGVRDFWRGTPGVLGELASRVTASADVFASAGRRGPTSSVNYVTSHDGFTLTDLVSYNHKHNQLNGEGNRDGSDNNRAWNTGVEGPTDDPAIIELRTRRRRSLLATLLLSQGVPMLLGGDELGRTQRGNNNAYSQDSELSWYDWDSVDETFLDFVRRLVALRRRHAVLRRRTWLGGVVAAGQLIEDIIWFAPNGKDMTPADWSAGYARAIAFFLNGGELRPLDPEGPSPSRDSFLVMLNAGDDPLDFVVPAGLGEGSWLPEIDTAEAGPPDTGPVDADDIVTVASFATVVLRRPSP